jgi:hypothetical protein
MRNRPAVLTTTAIYQFGCEPRSGTSALELLITIADQVAGIAIDDPNADFEVVPGNTTRVLEVHRVYPTKSGARRHRCALRSPRRMVP